MRKRLRFVVGVATAMAMLVGCTGNSGQQQKGADGEPVKTIQEWLEEAPKKLEEKKAEADEERSALSTDFTVDYEGIKTEAFRAGCSVHDPSILEVDGTYYIYGSHMTAAKSTDLRTWQMIGNGYSKENPVYGKLCNTEGKDSFAYTGHNESFIPTDSGGGMRLWAPDVVYNEKAGKYFMYYCTTSSFNASTLCVATADKPEGPFEWKANLIYSGLTGATIKETNVLDYVTEEFAYENYVKDKFDDLPGNYNYTEWPNALDPTIFYDKDGKFWMVYGSWSGGIFLLELDPETGEAIHPEADPENNVDAYFGKKLLGGGHVSMEAPYILYDSNSDYYYLYVAYGGLSRTGGYQVRVYRSKNVDGPYVDNNDKELQKGNPAYYGLKLSGNYMLPGLTNAYMATGHNSAFVDKDGRSYIVNHARFDRRGEYHEPRVHQYIVNQEGWPCMLPYATDGEKVSESGYSKEQIVGEYYVTNQGTKIDAKIAEPVKLVFTEKGNVLGEKVTGYYEVEDGKYFVHIYYEEKLYSGVFCEMNDESGTKCMTFSAVGSNESLWGVKYYD